VSFCTENSQLVEDRVVIKYYHNYHAKIQYSSVSVSAQDSRGTPESSRKMEGVMFTVNGLQESPGLFFHY